MTDQQGLSIQYDNGVKRKIELVSMEEKADHTFYRFENKQEKLGYQIDLLENGNIVLNRGKINSKEEALSKPMEYRKINYTFRVIRELAETETDLDTFFDRMFSVLPDEEEKYKIIATSDGSFYGGVDKDKSDITVQSGDGNIGEEYNLSTDPRAVTVAEIRQLIEEIKQERVASSGSENFNR